jgi:transposase
VGKKVKGRKRHIVTDIMGNLLAVVVHAANIHDAGGGVDVMKEAYSKCPSLKGVCGDDAYRKSFKETIEKLGLRVDISEKISSVWEILPKRWRVERTFAWMNGSRRLSKDYEINTISAENMTIISHLATLFRRF